MIGTNLFAQAPLALSLALAGGAPPVQQCSTVKLSPPLGENQEVVGYAVVPDDTDRVTYLSDIMRDDFFELYTVPANGESDGIFFDVGLPDGSRVYGLPKFSSQRLGVFRADFDVPGRVELYSVSTADGGDVPLKLNGPLAANGDVQPEFFITPDGATVVYLAEELSVREELYAVAIAGGQSRRLNTALTNGNVQGDFQITPDGNSVVYRATTSDFRRQLFVAPIAGGDPIALNSPIPDGSEVSSFQISPDGNTVIYEADQETNNTNELFRVPITGGPSVKLNGPELERSVEEYAISADGAHVVYLAPSFEGSTFLVELYSVPMTGGTPVRLNTDLPVDGFVLNFTITPNSERVVYRASQEVRTIGEIYSVPIAGGTPVKLSGDATGTDGSRTFHISPNGEQVVSVVDLDPDFTQSLSLRLSPIEGGNTQNLAGPFLQNSNIDEFVITADNSRAIFSGDLLVADQTEIFSTNLSPNATLQRLSGEFPMGGEVGRSGNDDFQITVNGQRIVYLADQDTVGVKELYSSELNCDGVFRNGFE